MNLHPRFFDQILNGAKTIEVRLNDKKRRLLKVGDHIEFTSRANPKMKVRTEIIKLFPFPTFSELFNAFPAEAFGAASEECLTEIYTHYTKDDENHYGVLGIQLKKLKT